MTELVDLTPEIAKELKERLTSRIPTDDDWCLIVALVDSYVTLGAAFREKNGRIHSLLTMIFGPFTEKASKILDLPPKPKSTKPKPKGHGRRGASSYTGADRTTLSNELKTGDLCPLCEKGKVYPTIPGVLVRITGSAPLTAAVWDMEKLRCNLCGEVFSPGPPEGKKYDETAGAMVALLKYGTGVPFNRLEALQASLGIPLSASTQWDIVMGVGKDAHPAYEELVRQAAQGQIIHNDDTGAKILKSINENGRNGTFTTGMLSVTGARRIAIFATGHKHAGENLNDLLAKRHKGLGPPIQMCDALSRNMPKDLATIMSNCLSHGRRNFVGQAGNFPEECRYVIELLAEVYKNDETAKEEKMTPHERLDYHQAHSGPVMDTLREWMNGQFDEKRVEPNSGLGKAFSYMLNHWDPLTLFLRAPEAPLDNNICEQALKMAILHRKNSYFYRTLNGAHVGDLFMSLIHTCRLSKVNPFRYLVALQKYAAEVAKDPHLWLPWNYEIAMAALPR
jgi:transposase